MEDAGTAYGLDSATSLDPLETSLQALLTCTESQERLHGPTSEARFAILKAFTYSSDAGLFKRAERMGECCRYPTFCMKTDGTVALSLQRCRDRMCPVCAKVKGSQTAGRVKEAIQQMKSVRFVTLTAKNSGRTLKEMIDHVTTSFRDLRRSFLWKSTTTGGIWVIEIKQGTQEATWNVHLHMLVDGGFIDQASLSSAWLQASGDSFIVDIRKVHSTEGAAHYVTKYVSKPGNFARFSDEEICAYAKAVKGRRMFGTFGKLYKPVTDKDDTIEPAALSGATISARRLLQMACEGHSEANAACDLIRELGGFAARSIGAPPPLQRLVIDKPFMLRLGALIQCCIDANAVGIANALAAENDRDEFGRPPPVYDQLSLLPECSVYR